MLPLYLIEWATFAGASKRHLKDIKRISSCVRDASPLTRFKDVHLLNKRIFAAHITQNEDMLSILNRNTASIDSCISDKVSRDSTLFQP